MFLVKFRGLCDQLTSNTPRLSYQGTYLTWRVLSTNPDYHAGTVAYVSWAKIVRFGR